jgi:hypothetical protein
MLYVTIVSLCKESVPFNYYMKQGPAVARVVWLLSYELNGRGSIPNRALIFLLQTGTLSHPCL